MSGPVICGVDWSDESVAAVGVAARLCERLGATLLVAHAVEDSLTFPYGDQAELNRRRHRAHAAMTGLFDRVERRFASVEVEGRVLYGPPANELGELAAEQEAALLVVGSRGRGAIKAALFGSVSSALSRAADRPVVIVGRDAIPRNGETDSPIVCGVDDSQHAASVARIAATLAQRLGTELVLVHAHTPIRSAATIPAASVAPPVDHEALDERQRRAGQALLEQLAADAERQTRVRTRLERDSPAAALELCAKSEHAELIVVGTHGHGPLASALLGSTCAALAAASPVPVVMVPEGAALRAAQAAAGGNGR